MLYAANKFEFRNINNFVSVSTCILSHRMSTIQPLYLSHLLPGYMFIMANAPTSNKAIYNVKPPTLDWIQACTIMSGMKSLQMLWLDLWLQSNDLMSSRQEEAILGPLNSINAPADFVVKVTWKMCDGEAERATRPLKLLRV